MPKLARFSGLLGGLAAILWLPATALAQTDDDFDEIAAVEQLFAIAEQIESEDVDNAVLASWLGNQIGEGVHLFRRALHHNLKRAFF